MPTTCVMSNTSDRYLAEGLVGMPRPIRTVVTEVEHRPQVVSVVLPPDLARELGLRDTPGGEREYVDITICDRTTTAPVVVRPGVTTPLVGMTVTLGLDLIDDPDGDELVPRFPDRMQCDLDTLTPVD